MQIPVLIEPVAGNGYRARGLSPQSLIGEGATREEALLRLRQQLQAGLGGGAEIVSLEIPLVDNPLTRGAGIFEPGDPIVEEWKQIMAENRKREDEELGIR